MAPPGDCTDDPSPTCNQDGCDAEAAFWIYDPRTGWDPACELHLVHRHPSLELHAWLAAGYARPVERGRPTAPPADPRGDRARAFREAIHETLE